MGRTSFVACTASLSVTQFLLLESQCWWSLNSRGSFPRLFAELMFLMNKDEYELDTNLLQNKNEPHPWRHWSSTFTTKDQRTSHFNHHTVGSRNWQMSAFPSGQVPITQHQSRASKATKHLGSKIKEGKSPSKRQFGCNWSSEQAIYVALNTRKIFHAHFLHREKIARKNHFICKGTKLLFAKSTFPLGKIF